MPVEVLWNDTSNSTLETNGTFQRHTVGFRIWKMPTTLDPSDFLFQAAYNTAGMPADNSPHPTRPGLQLVRRQFYGASTDAVGGVLIYETPTFDFTTNLLIEIDGDVASYTTTHMPGTREPFKVGYTPSDSDASTLQNSIPEDYVEMTLPRGIQMVTVTQLFQGTMSLGSAFALAQKNGLVNDAPWPNITLGQVGQSNQFGTQPTFGTGSSSDPFGAKVPGFTPDGAKPAGAWMIRRARASISRYSGMVQRTISALSQGDDKWVAYGILQDRQTGRYAHDQNTDSDMNALRDMSFTAKTITKKNGILRADYPGATSFQLLFGF